MEIADATQDGEIENATPFSKSHAASKSVCSSKR